MSKNYAIIIQFVLPLTTFYRSGAQKSNVYKRDVFVTSWRFHNRAWQPQRHDRLPETSGTLWIHRGALTNQRCSLATGCKITADSKLIIDNLLDFFEMGLCFDNHSNELDISKKISYCQHSTSFMIWYARQLTILCYICTMRHNINTQSLRLIEVCYEESTD